MNPGKKARRFAQALVTRTLEFEVERMPFRLENVSARKLIAMFRSELNCARRKPRTPWYPSRLMIEPSSACTLKCPLCPVGCGQMVRPRTNMRLDTYRALMDEVGPYAVYAQLWMYGEPFLNPDIYDMIAYARAKNVATVSSTNGQHIQTREEAEKLVASGLDSLIVAVDGASQETFSRYRVGGSLAKVIRCLELIREAKRSLGSEKPRVNVRTVVMKQNEGELSEIADLARKFGADMVSHKTAFMASYTDHKADEQFVPDDEYYRRFLYHDGTRDRKPGNGFGCRRPWDRLSVTAEGVVLSCEYDFNISLPWGRCADGSSFMKAWMSPEAEAFRRQFLEDETVYPFCASCSCGWMGTKESTTRDVMHLREPIAAG